MKTVFVITALTAVLSYHMYVPVLPGYDWRTSLEGAKLLALENTVMLADWFGADSAKFFRHLLNIVYGSGANPPPDPYVHFRNLHFAGVPVRLYRPHAGGEEDGHLPAVVIYHGGGWTIGSVDAIHTESLRLSRQLKAVVVSVEYRLAPEHPYPAPLDDCVAATRHFLLNAAKYGADPSRVALKGLSAGGTLAAGVARQLHTLNSIHGNNTSPLPKLLVLVNAPLQALSFRLPSHQYNAYNAFQTKASYMWFLGNYLFGNQRYHNRLLNNRHVPMDLLEEFENEVFRVLPDDEMKQKYELENSLSYSETFKKILKRLRIRYISKFFYNGKNVQDQNEDKSKKSDTGINMFWIEHKYLFLDENAFPLMAQNHSHMPKTHIYNCYWDILRDDSHLYAQKLRQAGVEVTEVTLYECHHLWNVFHQFDAQSSQLYKDLILRIAQDL